MSFVFVNQLCQLAHGKLTQSTHKSSPDLSPGPPSLMVIHPMELQATSPKRSLVCTHARKSRQWWRRLNKVSFAHSTPPSSSSRKRMRKKEKKKLHSHARILQPLRRREREGARKKTIDVSSGMRRYKQRASRCCTADVCLCQSVNQLYNNQKYPNLFSFPLLGYKGWGAAKKRGAHCVC